jgi:hypothetical protein
MKLRSIYLVAVALMLMASASCKKDLLKANTSPTGVSAANYNPNFSLSSVQMMYTGSTDFAGEVWQTEWGGIGGYIQHVSSTNTAFYYGDKYLLSTGNVGKYFEEAYSQQVEPVVDLIRLTQGNAKYANLHQMARIMRALVFQRITDMYGDVPYSQAGLGYYEKIYTPVYDKQQDIYTDMLKEVSQAVDSLNDDGDKPTGDLYYFTNSAQIEEWKKFGNSLLVRLAMRLSKIDPTTAQSWIAKVQGKTMTSNGDNAIVQHELGNLTQNRDAWVIIQQDSADLKLCSTFVNNMKANNDPRLSTISWIFTSRDSKPADQLGLPPGFIIGGKDSTIDITKQTIYPKVLGMQGFSRFNDIMISYGSPTLILTYAETELLLADAAQRWGSPTDAATHYRNGVIAAIEQLEAYPGNTVTDGLAIAYADAHTYNAADGLNQINTQYWLCTIMDEYEAWANWRRTSSQSNTQMVRDTVAAVFDTVKKVTVYTTALREVSGYPQLHATNYKANITKGTIPRRLQYPISQTTSNLANYNKAVSALGGDGQTERVWWDKK